MSDSSEMYEVAKQFQDYADFQKRYGIRDIGGLHRRTAEQWRIQAEEKEAEERSLLALASSPAQES